MTTKIAYLSTYPPRKCGIATFTLDLSSAIQNATDGKYKATIIALNNNEGNHDYPEEVEHQIRDKVLEDYSDVAVRINNDPEIKLVCIQHEFKIFGSDYGENILKFLEIIKKPVVITFHAVFPNPSYEREGITRHICKKTNKVIVMNKIAKEILVHDYDISSKKIKTIPHGIHDVNFEYNDIAKNKLGYSDRKLISSFGLLRPGRGRVSSGKGYEYVLEGLPEVIKQFPNLLFLIIGATHPKILKQEGEKYRDFLKERVKELGLENNVKFINKYCELDEILEYIRASDIYISSSLNEDQISSGTLVYAMGCGRACISTRFLHAKAVLTPERGILIDFKSPSSYSEAIIKILSDDSLKNNMGKNSYQYTRHTVWKNVGLVYARVFDRIIN